jgi:rhamnosyltransferase
LNIYFDDVIFLTNQRDLLSKETNFLKKIGVSMKMVKNEGLDFGMWHKGLSNIDTNKYDQIAFINDSCILFHKGSLKKILDWVDKSDLDYCGITDSDQINYHLQSYFTIVKKRAIPKLVGYYKLNGIINSDDSRDIINTYEIGLSQFLINNNFKIGSYFSHKDYTTPNISLMEAPHLISKGCPLVKMKLIMNIFRDHERSYLESFKFNFNYDYKSLIKTKINNSNLYLGYIMEF